MRFVALSLVLALAAAACGGEETRPTNGGPVPGGDTAVSGLLVASNVDRADPDAPAGDVGAVSAGLQGFAARLYGSLAGSEGNLVFSPVGISTALAMAYAGAAGTTAEEMAAVLGNPLTAEEFHAAVNVLDQAIESRDRQATEQEGGVEISIANSLWGQDGMAFRDAFLDLLALDYGAGMMVVDFIDPASREEARLTINDWVAGETNDRIEDLLGEGVLDEMVRLVLVNAVYLNAAWLAPFDEARTVEAPFTLLDGSEVPVPTMHIDASMPSGRGDGWQALQIPYSGGELGMLVILPDQGAFSQVEASLSDGLIDEVVESLSPNQVVIALPKFEIRTQIGLVPALQAIGLAEATSARADFSGMTGAKDLFISDAIHEAWISADEAGTEAAAATGVIMSLTAAPIEPLPFVVDRPFLFALRDAATGSILFMGRVVDPRG